MTADPPNTQYPPVLSQEEAGWSDTLLYPNTTYEERVPDAWVIESDPGESEADSEGRWEG